MNNQSQQNNGLQKLVTIPNILSLLRLLMIPVFVWLYCVKKEYLWTVFVLVLSGLTDVADGFIARRFHMISDLGKILDPIADKLTQGAMLLCLFTRFPKMLFLLILMALKEFYMGISGTILIKKTGKVLGADWHGKVATCMLYAMMILHVLWHDIPAAVSNVTITLCAFLILLSLLLYGLRNRAILKSGDVL